MQGSRLSALWRVQVRATSRRISRTRELGVDSAHCKDAPPGGGRGPLVSYLPRLSRSPAQFFHHSRHFSLALSRREADHSA